MGRGYQGRDLYGETHVKVLEEEVVGSLELLAHVVVGADAGKGGACKEAEDSTRARRCKVSATFRGECASQRALRLAQESAARVGLYGWGGMR